MLRPGSYESGDLTTHIMESIYFFQLLLNGNLFPIWGGEMNATYGYPAFLFTYPLPFYLISLIHLFGFSFTDSVKLLLAIAYIFSGMFMFLWLKQEVKEHAAFVGSLFYLYVPFHLIDLHFRNDIGEIVAFVFLPLTLFATRKALISNKYSWYLLEILSLTFLILSHPAVSLVGFPFLIIYISIIIFNLKGSKKYVIRKQISCFIVTLLLSCFYWLSVLTQIQFTLNHHVTTSVSFIKILDLIYSPWFYGFLFQGPYGKFAYTIGYAHLFILLLSIFLLIKIKLKSAHKHLLVISFILFIFTCFMMLEYSHTIWQSIPLLKGFQFSYRLLGIVMFVISIIGAITTHYFRNKYFILFLCLFIVFSTMLNWGNRKNIPELQDSTIALLIPYTATNGAGLGQAVPMWANPNDTWAKKIPHSYLEIINGKGNITQLTRKNTYHAYIVNAKTKVIVKENTLYFPGWKVYIDKMQTSITILENSNPQGTFSFKVPEGKHLIEVRFEDTFFMKIGKWISLLTAVVLLILLIYPISKQYFFQKTSNQKIIQKFYY